MEMASEKGEDPVPATVIVTAAPGILAVSAARGARPDAASCAKASRDSYSPAAAIFSVPNHDKCGTEKDAFTNHFGVEELAVG